MRARLATLAPALLPALPALALFVGWSGNGGGYSPTSWYPGIFLLGGLLLAGVLGLGRVRVSRPLAAGLAALAAYTAWSYLSIGWADAPGVALEGANRTLLYLLAFALFAVLPWDERRALVAIGGFVLAIGVLGVVTAIDFGTAADAATMFLDARLQAPLGYHNADAALWTMAALPALILASRRELHPAWRGAFLAVAGVCAELAVLTQSRGWLATLPVVLLVAFVLVPGRVRLGVAAAAVGLAVAGTLPELLDVYRVGGVRTGGEASADVTREAGGAMWAILVSAVGLLATGAALGLADRKMELSESSARLVRRVAAGAAALAFAVGAVAGWVAVDGRPGERLDRAWEEFKANDLPVAGEASRFGSLGSSRYDFWRVALEVTADHPLAGVGQDNYAADYVERRSAGEETRWVHSLPLRLTTHTGAIGVLLFAAFLIATGVAARRVGSRRALVAACLTPLVVWLVHGSVEWLWEFPGLSAPAFAFGAVAVALGRPAPAAGVDLASAVRRSLTGLAALAGVALLLAAGGPYLSERAVERALDTPRSDLGLVLQRLDDGASWNPLAVRPALVAGLIAADAGREDVASRELRRALDREERNWFVHLELGLVASEADDDEAAAAAFRRASELNPLEPVVRRALRRVRGRRPLSRAAAHEELLNRARQRVGLPPRRIRG